MTQPAAADDSWSGERVARWLRQAAALERQMAPVSACLFGAARLAAGEAVLDVGCGAGPTTREAALAVGPRGRVTGLDVSADMLRAAQAEPAGPAAAPIDWVDADPVTWSPPEPGAYDVVMSRFGVMFFTDPPAAFATLARAGRDGGRLAMAVWSRRDRSAMFEVPLQVTARTLRRFGATPDMPPTGAGPFSLHDADMVAPLLRDAGWGDVQLETRALTLALSGGVEPPEAAAAAVDIGPTRAVLAGASDAQRDAVIAALTDEFAHHLDERGWVTLGAEVQLVTARR